MLSVEIIIVAALIVTNGLLAMSELAIVSARPARLKTMRDKGVRGAARALKLAADPGRFLSTVQIGITLVGVLSGAFSGATLGTRLAGFLAEAGISEGMADAAGVGIVVALITYASLIIGELVPKQIALRDPEGIAARMAPAMTLLATVAMPLVWFLDISGRAVLFVLGQRSEGSSGVSDEEIRMIIAEAEGAGVIEPGEGDMMEGVMRLADRTVRALMTPRRQVEWLEKDADEDALREALLAAEHSYLPVAGKELDEMAGVVRTRDLLRPAFEKKPIRLEKHLLKAPVVHDRASALDVLASLKAAEVPMALIHDEYGHFEGIVTPADILEAIAGEFRSDMSEDDGRLVQREDGSWLVSGSIPADEMADRLGIELPEKRDYATAAGFILSHLGHLPVTGEKVDVPGWRFEVIDLDGRRIDKLIAHRAPGEGVKAGQSAPA